MSLGKILIFAVVAYFVYSMLKRLWFQPLEANGGRAKNSNQKGIKIFKRKGLEKAKFDIDAESVPYEEVKENKDY